MKRNLEVFYKSNPVWCSTEGDDGVPECSSDEEFLQMNIEGCQSTIDSALESIDGEIIEEMNAVINAIISRNYEVRQSYGYLNFIIHIQ